MRKKIKVAVVGVGNCASSFLQGLHYYRKVFQTPSSNIGLINPIFNLYSIEDICVVAAFDVNRVKVGKDIAEAIWEKPNNTKKFATPPKTGVRVSAGPILDGIAHHMHNRFPLVRKQDNVRNILKKSGAEMLVNYLPTGSQKATEFWASIALECNVAFINAIPVFIASNKVWAKRFAQKKLPCAGDDIKSQVGATILHRSLIDLVQTRGLIIDGTYQIDVGGNTDFENMQNAKRYENKRKSKTDSIGSQGNIGSIKIASVDYIPYLQDNKVAYINIRGREFGDIPFEIEARISVEDSPNSAGVIIDTIRAMKVSLDRKQVGYQDWSAYYFKHPLVQLRDEEAKKAVDRFKKVF